MLAAVADCSSVEALHLRLSQGHICLKHAMSQSRTTADVFLHRNAGELPTWCLCWPLLPCSYTRGLYAADGAHVGLGKTADQPVTDILDQAESA